jgi:phosphatidylinositol alpha 1,6-mannosyltransferase
MTPPGTDSDRPYPSLPVTLRDVRSLGWLRLALFCDSYLPQLNGVSLLLERLVSTVRARGGAVRIYTTTDPHAIGDPEIRRWPSVSFWLYPEHRLALPTPASVRRELRAWRPTLVHAASPFGMGLGARAGARALGLPFVSSYHTSWSAYTRFYGLSALSGTTWRYIRWFHNSGIRTYAPTDAVRAELQSHGIARTAIWSRGVDTARFNPSYRSNALRQQLGADDSTVIAAYVGRLGAEKGLDVALNAMHTLRQRTGTRVLFVIAGDGPHEAELRRMAPPETIFVGRLAKRELSEFYASADMFVFPSATDTFGNVLLEAMASGLPVVGADVGPTRELLGDDRGLVFTPGDPAACAARIAELADAPTRRAALASHALTFASRRTWDTVFDELLTDYARVQSRQPKPAAASQAA